MLQKINIQLEIIEKSNKWVLESLKDEKAKNAYRFLVNKRRELNRKKFALEGNPAAAMYGESQVGKSYLISSLLSEEGEPFNIVDENDVVHNFIEEINPPGGGSESTSLVSRFSISYKPVNQKFPVKAVLLSPTDIALVLCDSFYNDIKANHDLSLKSEEINNELVALKEKLQGRNSQQKVLVEDDILDMQDYFKCNLTKAGEVLSSNFFEEVSLLISKVRSDEWKDVFALLWNKNEKFTTLFAKLIAEYAKLNFAGDVYLPLESVLYKYGTLLDVRRLKEIYFDPDRIESEYCAETKVLFFDNAQEREIILAKSYLCALSAELVFSQPETLLASKPFLKETDLLDFPGARARLVKPENLIEDKNIPELLLRGKVAYLFNKYSEWEKINILLFCSKHEQAGERTMPGILDNWVRKIVGETPEKRAEFIDVSKVPPLFIIGTFFNVNLKYDPQLDKPTDNSHFNYRWNQRFERTLAQEKIEAVTYKWFENWTSNQPNFQNIFLLRDFEKSENISNIFKGYNANKKESEEVVPENYPDFKTKLRQSFIEYDFVKRHFEDPENSWDRAASINEDGTKLIIDKLTIVANNINPARIKKIRQELNAIQESIIKLLNENYNSPDKAENLQKAKRTAGVIQLKLDSAFGGKRIELFGQMMKEIMVDNSTVFDFYEKKVKDIEHRDVVNMDKYSNIRMLVGLVPNDDDGNLERLRVAYEKPVISEHYTVEKLKEEFTAEDINLDELFHWLNHNYEQVKSNAQVWAEELENYWLEQCLQNKNHIIGGILSETLPDMQDMYKTLFQKLNISKVIAEKIRRYMDGSRSSENMHEMIADISVEILNNFIKSVGLDYYDKSNFDDLKEANGQNALGLVLEHNDLDFEENSREGAAQLITLTAHLPELLNQNPLPVEAKRLPGSRAYILWRDALKAGFVSVCEIPTYDVQANDSLKVIIDQCQTIKY